MKIWRGLGSDSWWCAVFVCSLSSAWESWMVGGGQMIDCKRSKRRTAHPSHPTTHWLSSSKRAWSFVWHVNSAFMPDLLKSILRSATLYGPLNPVYSSQVWRHWHSVGWPPSVMWLLFLPLLIMCFRCAWQRDQTWLPPCQHVSLRPHPFLTLPSQLSQMNTGRPFPKSVVFISNADRAQACSSGFTLVFFIAVSSGGEWET